jgi:catechol-2,3-dioxygenase
MPATRINHTSIVANSLDESARFYEELFGMERIATAKFSDPVLWLRAGTSQLHLFEADETATLRAHLRIHPAGWAQLYLRDPAGNLVEVDWQDVSSLSAETLAEASELGGQQGEAATATLFTA